MSARPAGMCDRPQLRHRKLLLFDWVLVASLQGNMQSVSFAFCGFYPNWLYLYGSVLAEKDTLQLVGRAAGVLRALRNRLTKTSLVTSREKALFVG